MVILIAMGMSMGMIIAKDMGMGMIIATDMSMGMIMATVMTTMFIMLMITRTATHPYIVMIMVKTLVTSMTVMSVPFLAGLIRD